MKNRIGTTAALLLSLTMFTECKKELELNPQGSLNGATFYQTERDFDAAALSPYSSLLTLYFAQFGEGWYQTQLYPDDDMTHGGNSANNYEDFNWTAAGTTDQFLALWTHCYSGISRSNVVLENLAKATGFTDESNKARYEAEAKFMRAYFYFILQTNFGNVPKVDKVVTSQAEAQLPNSQPGEIWDFIISDLQFAKGNLPATYNDANTGRATSGAATALLGKTYLYRAQWEGNAAFYNDAIREFTAVTGYKFADKWEDNFSPRTENNPESVFEIQFSEGGGNPWLSTDFGDLGAAGTGRQIAWMAACGLNNDCAPGANGLGYGYFHVTPSLQAEFEPGDPRRPGTIFLEGDDYFGATFDRDWSVSGSTPAKYIKQEGGSEVLDFGKRFPFNRSVNNERVIRYSDVLLMLAEARLLGSNDVAGAAQLINQVRRNIDKTGTILPDRPASATVQEMFKFLQHERRVELAFEGHRYNDLVRWHRAGLINIKTDVNFGRQIANQNWSTQNLIKPIPQAELDLNPNLKQNPGY